MDNDDGDKQQLDKHNERTKRRQRNSEEKG
jgi:hypothetical protein